MYSFPLLAAVLSLIFCDTHQQPSLVNGNVINANYLTFFVHEQNFWWHLESGLSILLSYQVSFISCIACIFFSSVLTIRNRFYFRSTFSLQIYSHYNDSYTQTTVLSPLFSIDICLCNDVFTVLFQLPFTFLVFVNCFQILLQLPSILIPIYAGALLLDLDFHVLLQMFSPTAHFTTLVLLVFLNENVILKPLKISSVGWICTITTIFLASISHCGLN